jgi:hypothetical protein
MGVDRIRDRTIGAALHTGRSSRPARSRAPSGHQVPETGAAENVRPGSYRRPHRLRARRMAGISSGRATYESDRAHDGEGEDHDVGDHLLLHARPWRECNCMTELPWLGIRRPWGPVRRPRDCGLVVLLLQVLANGYDSLVRPRATSRRRLWIAMYCRASRRYYLQGRSPRSVRRKNVFHNEGAHWWAVIYIRNLTSNVISAPIGGGGNRH